MGQDLTEFCIAYITKRGVPVFSLLCTAAVSCVTFITSFIPGQGKSLYLVVVSLSGVAGFVTWFGIAVAHYRFRKAFKVQGRSLDVLPMRTVCHPFGDIFNMIACPALALISGYSYFYNPPDPVGIVGNYAGLVFCAVGYMATKVYTNSKVVPLEDIDLDTGAAKYADDEELEKPDITGPWYRRLWKRMLIVFT